MWLLIEAYSFVFFSMLRNRAFVRSRLVDWPYFEDLIAQYLSSSISSPAQLMDGQTPARDIPLAG